MHEHAVTITGGDDRGLAFLQSPQQAEWSKQDSRRNSGHGNRSAFAVANLTLRESCRDPVSVDGHQVLHGPLQLSCLAPMSGPFGGRNARSSSGAFLEYRQAI